VFFSPVTSPDSRLTPKPAPHVDLLLACAGASPRVRPTADVDWPRFCALVEHHGMGPHVHAELALSGDVPAEALRALHTLHTNASEYSLLLTARLLALVEAFERAGIPLLTLKGPALAQQLYGDPAMRDSLDLDLLVPAAQVESAAALLESRGYALESELGWLGVRELARRCTELTFRSAAGTAVDLHWATSPADFPCAIPEARMWASVGSVSIAGHHVPVLSPACQLVYLCVHGTRHCWTKLRWACDVAMLVSGVVTIDWSDVEAIAKESRATRALALGLRLAHDLLGASLPDAVLHRVQADHALAPFTAQVSGRLRSPEPAPQPSGVARTMFNARLATSPWLKVRHLAALMKAPTDADAEWIRLPRPLLFLYYPFRAARLVTRYGRARVAG